MQLPPDTSSTHAAPHKDTATTMFHCRHHAFLFVFLTFATPYSFEAISSKNIYLGLITPEYRVPVVFIFVSMGLANSRRAFCAWALGEASFVDGTHACHSSAVYPYCVTEIVTPVWLSTSLDNCSELACRFSSTLLIRRRS